MENQTQNIDTHTISSANTYRQSKILAVFWFLAGAIFGVFGMLGFMENSTHKIGRLWVVPLLPTILVTISWASFALANGFWRDRWYVSFLGKAMSLILFSASIVPLVGGFALVSSGMFDLESIGYFVAGTLGIVFTIFNYRVAKQHHV